MTTVLRSSRLKWLSAINPKCAVRTMSSNLPLRPPSLKEETSQFDERTAEMSSFFSRPRFASLKRPYSPSDIVSKQGSLPVLPLPSSLLADKLYAILSNASAEGRPVLTMGAIDPVQMTQMARHQEVVYISGWAASSVLTTGNNEVGPDLACVRYRLAFRLISHNTDIIETTHIPPFQIRSTESSVPNNCTIENITMNGCPQHRINGTTWNTSTTFVQLLLTPTRGEYMPSLQQ
jgi:hypothetical protein